MNKSIIISIIISTLIIVGAIFFTSGSKPNSVSDTSTVINNQNISSSGVSSNVSVVNGIQIVELQARGGYSPRNSTAKAGIPTIIRFDTNNTFDCSLAVRIPSLNINKFLTQTGTTDIDIGSQGVGLFRGSCGMGMYPFEIDFQK